MEIKDLVPNKKNPRKISDQKLKMLKASLEKFGDLSGFVFNRRTNRLVSGHQRQKSLPGDSEIVIENEYPAPTAARTVAEGYAMIDGERFKYREVDADEVWETEAMLAANQHGGEWDRSLLQNALHIEGVNFEIAGFTMPELKEMKIDPPKVDLSETSGDKSEKNDDELPEAKPTRFKDGTVIRIGNITIACGDSTDVRFVESVIKSEIDFVFTDPPYGISEKTDRVVRSKYGLCEGGKFEKIIGDESTDAAINGLKVLSHVAENAPTVIFGANYFAHSLPETGNWLVWDKRVEDKQRDLNSDCELAWVYSKYKSVRIFRHLWKGMIKGSEHGEKRVHPTQKPVALVEWCIKEYSPECKTVLDLFGGSGSTAVACVNLNKTCYIFEMSPDYCEVIASRVERALAGRAY